MKPADPVIRAVLEEIFTPQLRGIWETRAYFSRILEQALDMDQEYRSQPVLSGGVLCSTDQMLFTGDKLKLCALFLCFVITGCGGDAASLQPAADPLSTSSIDITPTNRPQALGLFSRPAPTPDPSASGEMTDSDEVQIGPTSIDSPGANATRVLNATPSPTPIAWKTHPDIIKRPGVFLKHIVESTPVYFNETVMTVSVGRPHGTRLYLHNLITGSEIAEVLWEYDLFSALTIDNRLYLFGSSDHEVVGGHIGMAYLNEEYEISETTVVHPGRPDESIFNVSVAESPDGYVMAYEIDRDDLVHFSIRFAESSDLTNWTDVGAIAYPGIYAAAPTIRYSNGWYYLIYLRNAGHGYFTTVDRTRDFKNFEWFQGNNLIDEFTHVMSPFDADGEGINNSDVDLLEHDGMLYFTYADGDQQHWHDLRIATYDGTMEQFFDEFWPDN